MLLGRTGLHTGAEDLNLGPDSGTASALPAEHLPSPSDDLNIRSSLKVRILASVGRKIAGDGCTPGLQEHLSLAALMVMSDMFQSHASNPKHRVESSRRPCQTRCPQRAKSQSFSLPWAKEKMFSQKPRLDLWCQKPSGCRERGWRSRMRGQMCGWRGRTT